MSENDPNLGGGLLGSEDETDWASQEFNLIDYLGQDDISGVADADFEQDHNAEEDEMREKDLRYSTWQYNNSVLGGGPGNEQYENFPDPSIYAQPLNNHSYYSSGSNGGGGGGRDPHSTSTFNPDATLMPSTSRNSSMIGQAPTQIKMEPISSDMFDDGVYPVGMRAESESSYQSSSNGGRVHKPRKYRIKSENEKRNPVYRVKREKNNDAVRRSRDKAKREQERRDQRLRELENEDMKNKSLIKLQQQKIATLEKTLKQLMANCKCGSGGLMSIR